MSVFCRVGFSLPLLALAAHAAVWPDQLGKFQKADSPAPALKSAVMDEYGFQAAEAATYTQGKEKFAAVALRFRDATGAMAAYQARRPAAATQSQLGALAAETAKSVLVAHGNYLLEFDGYKPSVEELAPMLQVLPRLEQSPLPAVSGYLPAEGLAPNSERYILGPESLAAFENRVAPATVAFHMGTECQGGVFRPGDMKLLICSYPTHQIAMERVKEYQKIAGAVVKRSGPLVAYTIAPADANEAEKLLARIRFQAEITWSEYVPTQRDNIGDLVVNAMTLAGIILVFTLVSGLAFGGFRSFRRARRGGADDDAMITLHLSDR